MVDTINNLLSRIGYHWMMDSGSLGSLGLTHKEYLVDRPTIAEGLIFHRIGQSIVDELKAWVSLEEQHFRPM